VEALLCRSILDSIANTSEADYEHYILSNTLRRPNGYLSRPFDLFETNEAEEGLTRGT
jgi:hypothetical protein